MKLMRTGFWMGKAMLGRGAGVLALGVFAVAALSQVTYQGTIGGSDGSSATVVYTLPNAPTTQTTVGLRNTGSPKTSSGTMVITPVSEGVSAPPPTTGGAAITMTNPPGALRVYDGVFVHCHASAFSDAQLLGASIVWNFGDAGSAYNVMKGWNAAHSYATAGTYTITLTISAASGQATASMPVTIATVNPVSVAAGGSPKFASGGVYSLATGGSYTGLNLAGLSNVLILGNGATINAGNSNCVTLSGSSSHVTMVGLNGTVGSNGAADFCDPVGNAITLIGASNGAGGQITACENGFNLNANPTNVLIQGWTVPDGSVKATKTTMDGYFAWVQGQEVNVIGNTVANTISQAIIRADATGTKDINISYNALTKTTPASDSFKNCLTLMWSNYTTAYMNRCTNGPVQTGPLGDVPGSGASNSASWTNGIIDSNVLFNSKIIICPETIGLMVSNNVIHSPNTNAIWINATTSFGSTTWQVQNVTLSGNTVQSTDDYSGFLYLDQGEAKNVSVVNNVYADPNASLGNAGNAYIYDTNADQASFSAISGNVWGSAAGSDSSAFCFGNGQTSSTAWWGLAKLQAAGFGKGDVIQTVSFGSTYSAGSAGSSLPVGAN